MIAGANTYRQHGGLGDEPARFSRGLNPQPNLKAVIKTITPGELFFMLRNGTEASGMPAFGTGKTPVPDQQPWSLVAFPKAVPSLSDDDLRAWRNRHAAQR